MLSDDPWHNMTCSCQNSKTFTVFARRGNLGVQAGCKDCEEIPSRAKWNVRMRERNMHRRAVLLSHQSLGHERAVQRACTEVVPQPWDMVWDKQTYGNRESGKFSVSCRVQNAPIPV